MVNQIYILALKDSCFYVGRSINASQRIKKHFAGMGSAWTKLHKPIGVLKVIECSMNQEEDMWTKYMMRQYSIDRVRGGSHVSLVLEEDQIKFLKRQRRGNEDKCFVCGKVGHFANSCQKKLNFKRAKFPQRRQQNKTKRIARPVLRKIIKNQAYLNEDIEEDYDQGYEEEDFEGYDRERDIEDNFDDEDIQDIEDQAGNNMSMPGSFEQSWESEYGNQPEQDFSPEDEDYGQEIDYSQGIPSEPSFSQDWPAEFEEQEPNNDDDYPSQPADEDDQYAYGDDVYISEEEENEFISAIQDDEYMNHYYSYQEEQIEMSHYSSQEEQVEEYEQSYPPRYPIDEDSISYGGIQDNFMFNTLHSYGHEDDFDDFDLDLEPFDEDYPDIGDDFDIY